MENIEDIKAKKIEQLENIIKSHKTLEKNVSNLNLIANKLQTIADETLEYAANDNPEKTDNISKLKHDLNNSEHQLIQISKFTEEMVSDFTVQSKELMALLRSLL